MKNESKNTMTELLSGQLSCYISLVEKEYSDYVTLERKSKLSSIKLNPEQSIEWNKEKGISFYVSNDKIYFPLKSIEVLNSMSKLSGFGSEPNHSSCLIENYVVNDNDFTDYIHHVYKKGLTPLNYFQENLLHEAMHLCGCGGSSNLEEGLTELKTREVAQNYGLLTTGCAYPKEVKVVLELQKILGEEVINKIAFLGDRMNAISLYLKDTLGSDIENFYFTVRKEIKEASYFYKIDLNKINNPQEKIELYNKIDYHKVYETIDKFHCEYQK